MRIKNYKKFVRSIVLLLGIILLISFMVAKPSLSHGDPLYNKIYANAGDTLWQIASEQVESNNYYSNKNISYIIYDLKKINNLTNSTLSIGQELLIPVL